MGARVDEDRLAYFRLMLVEGLGPAAMRSLLDHYRSPARALAAPAAELEDVIGLEPDVARAIKEATTEDRAREQYERMLELGARILFQSDEEFPEQLREIATAPAALMIRGELLPTDKVAVAIVGSRRCSVYGRKMAADLAYALAARGIVVVSGLARGIDGAAHAAALEAGGRTIAVLASGLANIYPPEHGELADRVAAAGAIVSEAPLDGPPIGKLFPQRNRIISGLCLGVVVVEAATRSGALSTARHALDQNREVFAVPGRVGDRASEGSNQLLKDGACLVRSVEDILEQLGPIELKGAPEAPAPRVAPSLGGVEKTLWDTLGSDDLELETLLERTGLRASQASASLLMLEMRKLVRRLPGNRYVRA